MPPACIAFIFGVKYSLRIWVTYEGSIIGIRIRVGYDLYAGIIKDIYDMVVPITDLCGSIKNEDSHSCLPVMIIESCINSNFILNGQFVLNLQNYLPKDEADITGDE